MEDEVGAVVGGAVEEEPKVKRELEEGEKEGAVVETEGALSVVDAGLPKIAPRSGLSDAGVTVEKGVVVAAAFAGCDGAPGLGVSQQGHCCISGSLRTMHVL